MQLNDIFVDDAVDHKMKTIKYVYLHFFNGHSIYVSSAGYE